MSGRPDVFMLKPADVNVVHLGLALGISLTKIVLRDPSFLDALPPDEYHEVFLALDSLQVVTGGKAWDRESRGPITRTSAPRDDIDRIANKLADWFAHLSDWLDEIDQREKKGGDA